MEWQRILEGVISSSPVAAILAFAAHKLWGKNESLAVELRQIAKEKDSEIARLNEARLQDLKAIAKLDD